MYTVLTMICVLYQHWPIWCQGVEIFGTSPNLPLMSHVTT